MWPPATPPLAAGGTCGRMAETPPPSRTSCANVPFPKLGPPSTARILEELLAGRPEVWEGAGSRETLPQAITGGGSGECVAGAGAAAASGGAGGERGWAAPLFGGGSGKTLRPCAGKGRSVSIVTERIPKPVARRLCEQARTASTAGLRAQVGQLRRWPPSRLAYSLVGGHKNLLRAGTVRADAIGGRPNGVCHHNSGTRRCACALSFKRQRVVAVALPGITSHLSCL